MDETIGWKGLTVAGAILALLIAMVLLTGNLWWLAPVKILAGPPW